MAAHQLAALAARLEALEAKQGLHVSASSSASDDLEAQVARIEKAAQALADNQGAGRLASVVVRLVKIENKLTGGAHQTPYVLSLRIIQCRGLGIGARY